MPPVRSYKNTCVYRFLEKPAYWWLRSKLTEIQYSHFRSGNEKKRTNPRTLPRSALGVMLPLEAVGSPEAAPPDFAGEHGWVLVAESSTPQWHGRACVPLVRLLELPLTISVTHVSGRISELSSSVFCLESWTLVSSRRCLVWCKKGQRTAGVGVRCGRRGESAGLKWGSPGCCHRCLLTRTDGGSHGVICPYFIEARWLARLFRSVLYWF